MRTGASLTGRGAFSQQTASVTAPASRQAVGWFSVGRSMVQESMLEAPLA
jgi:hypothetical protein